MIKMKERGQRKMFSCQKHFSKNKLVQNDKKIGTIKVASNVIAPSSDLNNFNIKNFEAEKDALLDFFVSVILLIFLSV